MIGKVKLTTEQHGKNTETANKDFVDISFSFRVIP